MTRRVVQVRRVVNHDPRTLERWVNALLADLDPGEVIRVGDIAREDDPDDDDRALYACTIVFCLAAADQPAGDA